MSLYCMPWGDTSYRGKTRLFNVLKIFPILVSKSWTSHRQTKYLPCCDCCVCKKMFWSKSNDDDAVSWKIFSTFSFNSFFFPYLHISRLAKEIGFRIDLSRTTSKRENLRSLPPKHQQPSFPVLYFAHRNNIS